MWSAVAERSGDTALHPTRKLMSEPAIRVVVPVPKRRGGLGALPAAIHRRPIANHP